MPNAQLPISCACFCLLSAPLRSMSNHCVSYARILDFDRQSELKFMRINKRKKIINKQRFRFHSEMHTNRTPENHPAVRERYIYIERERWVRNHDFVVVFCRNCWPVAPTIYYHVFMLLAHNKSLVSHANHHHRTLCGPFLVDSFISHHLLRAHIGPRERWTVKIFVQTTIACYHFANWSPHLFVCWWLGSFVSVAVEATSVVANWTWLHGVQSISATMSPLSPSPSSSSLS